MFKDSERPWGFAGSSDGRPVAVQWAATTEFKLNLLRPVRDGVLRARADIISMSRRTAVVRIDITNDTPEGGARLAAAAQGTVSIQDPR